MLKFLVYVVPFITEKVVFRITLVGQKSRLLKKYKLKCLSTVFEFQD